MTLTQEEAHRLFEYRDGALYWKVSTAYRIKVGSAVAEKTKNRYPEVSIKYSKYKLYQIIFLMHKGYIPALIDHIDNNPINNKIENLREADKTKNGLNAKIRIDNTSGCKNVNWQSQKSKWQVRLCINKKSVSFGLYKDLELADLVAQEARDLHFGQFARHA